MHSAVALLAVLTSVLAVGVAPTSAVSAQVRVGHTIERIVVNGAAQNEPRQIDVHLWYPADVHGLRERPRTVYSSRLRGHELIPERWDPLSWTVAAEVAREGAAIDAHGKPFPVIVFSHGSVNDPIDYAHTLELIAAEGFVVAAPTHVNNTQDDVRIDAVNRQAGFELIPCNDGRPGLCSRQSVLFSMADRARDITAVLDRLPRWFGDRVDATEAGVLGHSRGTVTALTIAGGSRMWGIAPEPRVKAIMGLAIGGPAVTFGADVANVTVPAVLVAGGLDRNPGQAVSEDAFVALGSTDKLFVGIPNATHRSFDSTYCAQLQSAGAIAVTNPRAILDQHSVPLIAASAPGGNSGKAVHYCAAEFFTSPVDITGLVRSTSGSEFPPVPGPPSVCITTAIPCTGLDTDEVKEGVTAIAASFFDTALDRDGRDGIHFTRHLAPRWLMEHVPMVGCAEAEVGPRSVLPPGQAVTCLDRE